MRIKSKALSIIWKVILLACCSWGLLDGAGILAGHYTSNFPHMFTNIANIFTWGYFVCAVIWLCLHLHDENAVTFAPMAKYTAAISLLVTMLIGHFMLFNALFQNGHLVWHLVILHYVVPLMTLLDWLLFDQKGKMPVWGPAAWLSLVLGYLAFVMVAAGIFGIYMGGGTTADETIYPYTFLDPGIVGAGGVAGFCGAMLAAFLFLGYLLFFIDRILGKKSRAR